MKLAVISDVHGNETALDEVFQDLPDVDMVVCAGDVVGYNPWHAECVEAIREREIPTIGGNHDRAVATGKAPRFNHMARAAVTHARKQLSDDQLEWLDDLPPERGAAGDRVKIVHGHPDDPDHYTRPDEFAPELLGDEDVLIMGHTHVQYHESFEEGIVMNPGSVGQPRDGDPRAAYAVVDLDAMTVDERRVEYDVEAVVDAIEDAGLPRTIGRRLRMGN